LTLIVRYYRHCHCRRRPLPLSTTVTAWKSQDDPDGAGRDPPGPLSIEFRKHVLILLAGRSGRLLLTRWMYFDRMVSSPKRLTEPELSRVQPLQLLHCVHFLCEATAGFSTPVGCPLISAPLHPHPQELQPSSPPLRNIAA